SRGVSTNRGHSPEEPRSREAHLLQEQASGSDAGVRPPPTLLHAVRDVALEFAGRMRLRTKFLLSLALVTLALMTGALLSVRQSLQAHAQPQLHQDSRHAML